MSGRITALQSRELLRETNSSSAHYVSHLQVRGLGSRTRVFVAYLYVGCFRYRLFGGRESVLRGNSSELSSSPTSALAQSWKD